MGKTFDELMQYLGDMGIEVSTIRHAAVFTVAEAQNLRGQVSGAHTKNLFLKDKKDNYFLVTVDEDAEVDLKTMVSGGFRWRPSGRPGPCLPRS